MNTNSPRQSLIVEFIMTKVFEVRVSLVLDESAGSRTTVGVFGSREAAEECAAAIRQQLENAPAEWRERWRGWEKGVQVWTVAPVATEVEAALVASAEYFELSPRQSLTEGAMESMESFEARVLERTGHPLSALPVGSAADFGGSIVCRRNSTYVLWVEGDPEGVPAERRGTPAEWLVVTL